MQRCLWSKSGKWNTIHWSIDKLKHLVFLKFVLLPCFRWNKFPKLASVVKCWSMTLATASYETSWDVMSCRHMWSTETSCMVTQRVSLLSQSVYPRVLQRSQILTYSWHWDTTHSILCLSWAPSIWSSTSSNRRNAKAAVRSSPTKIAKQPEGHTGSFKHWASIS